jgi:hypothetical protein
MFRITSGLLEQIHDDLSRPHQFALERVAFLTCRSARLPHGGTLFLAQSAHVVAEEDYEPSRTMGALLGGAAFRKILQYAYGHRASIFHVHRHDHFGAPQFSTIDLQESAKFVPDFFKVCPELFHGTIVFSHDSATGLIWRSKTSKPVAIDVVMVVGSRIVAIENERRG